MEEGARPSRLSHSCVLGKRNKTLQTMATFPVFCMRETSLEIARGPGQQGAKMHRVFKIISPARGDRTPQCGLGRSGRGALSFGTPWNSKQRGGGAMDFVFSMMACLLC